MVIFLLPLIQKNGGWCQYQAKLCLNRLFKLVQEKSVVCLTDWDVKQQTKPNET